MKNYKDKKFQNNKIKELDGLDPDEVMKDFQGLDELLDSISDINVNVGETEIESLTEVSNNIKEDLESKYSKYLDDEDYKKDENFIKKHQKEQLKELEKFKSSKFRLFKLFTYCNNFSVSSTRFSNVGFLDCFFCFLLDLFITYFFYFIT